MPHSSDTNTLFSQAKLQPQSTQMEDFGSSQIYLIDVPATSANMGAGFDCFGIALQLYNRFVFRVMEDQPGELVFRANFSLKQNPRTNLVYKAYRYTLDCIGFNGLPGIEVNVISEIPSARGLGSSASAVVAGILAAGAIAGVNLRLSEAIEIATELEGHPDNVAPAILGGFTISTKDRNGVYSEKLDWPEELAILVGIPDIKVRTQSARKVLPRNVSFEDAVFNIQCASLFISALVKKDWRGLGIAMNDRLHQSARASLIPGLNRVLTACRDSGAIGAVLSGSGPCILSVVAAANQHAIKSVSNAIQKSWRHVHVDSEVKQLQVQKHTTKIKRINQEEMDRIMEPHRDSFDHPNSSILI
jgi:homoserine kinase